MKTTFNLFTPIIVLAALAAGCAKEQNYEKVYKESVFTKSALSTDPNDPYVYVPSVGETPKDVTASRSFWMGEQKLVTFKYEEDKLVVEELPREDRFSGNRNNFSPVMEFSIEHKDFRCKEDQFGECANQEEEVNDKPWQSKRYAKIDFASLKLDETNTLPEQLTNAFMGCYGEGKTVVKEVKVEKDALNIQITKTWKADIACADIQTFADLRNMSFTVNYFYSFVKLSKLASQGYETIKYPFEDQNSFGYFTTEMTKLTADNRTRDDSKMVMMNRWNPNRKEIVYYLNDAFYKEGMESILENTKQAIATINNSFEKAGVDMRIKLEDGRGKDIGDLRNNFLILVDDPQASGVIGYGPSIANPRTGEILKAQTVMYYGTIKKFISETYDELIEEKAAEAVRVQAGAEASRAGVTSNVAVSSDNSARVQSHNALLQRLTSTRPVTAAQNTQRRVNTRVGMSLDIKKEMFNPARKIELKHWLDQLKNRKNLTETEIAKAQLNEMSHRCFYHSSLVNWHDSLASDISAEGLGIEELKPWNDLSESDKEKVIAKLMPNVWVPTLVHEFGHNLGLRHNFNGSEDKNNYYSAQELRSLNIKRDVTYSSVMDYSNSSLNQLPVMGKYDIAALRYGYKREVELKDGSIAKLPAGVTLDDLKKSGQDKDLREFQFCTDEHVEVNPGCNRFDDGSGLKAIAENFVNNYKKNYNKRNYRNRRLNFDSYSGDVNYYFGLDYTFESLRRFFEVYDRLGNLYPTLINANWDEEIENAEDEATREIIRSNKEFFEGMKDAAMVAADFYLEVLNTPDVHCAIFDTQLKRIVALLPLSQFGGEAESCFSPDVRLNPRYLSVGQTGKFINNQRFDSSLPGELNADPSQISVRGIWMDKVLAMEYLTKRVMGISTFDDYRGNFLDYPVFAEKITDTLTSLITDSITTDVKIDLVNGESMTVEYSFPVGASHKIKRSFHPGLNRFLGINKVEVDLRELLLPIAKKSFAQADDIVSNWGMFNTLSVVRLGPTTVVNADQIKKTAEFKDAQGRLISRFGAAEENALAIELMELREFRQIIEKFKPEQVEAVIKDRETPKPPVVITEPTTGSEETAAGNEAPAVSEELKPLYELPVEVLKMYLNEQLPAEEHLMRMFLIMQ